MTEDQARKTPPAILHDGHALDAVGILDEVTGPTGVVLWQLARDLSLWAATVPGLRGQLFTEPVPIPAELDPTLRAPILQLREQLARPATARASVLVGACEEIYLASLTTGHLQTAGAFIQAAALARPGDPNLARRVGRIASERAEHGRAESWLRRALTLARRLRAWECFGFCLIDLGINYRQRGNLSGAREYFLRAYAIGCRHRRRHVARMAAHDLFELHLQMARFEESDEWAARASRLYKPKDPGLMRFANDLAFSWMTRGEFAAALRVFQTIVPRCDTPAMRLTAMANVIRAAGGCGDRTAFEAAWTAAVGGFLLPGLEQVAAECCLDMARGAASLGDWSRAERAGQMALSLADMHGQARVAFAAQALIDSMRAERRVLEDEAVARHLPGSHQIAARLAATLGGID